MEKRMGQRHFFCASEIPNMDNDRNWNHPQPDPRLRLENGLFMLPVENAAASGVNNMPSLSVPPRPNDRPFSYFSSESARTSDIVTPHNSYLHSSAGSSNQARATYIQHGQPCYNQYSIGGPCSSIDPQMDYGRGLYKRKSPAFSTGSGSSNGYYAAGSSSNFHISSDHLLPKPMINPQCWPGMGPSIGNNNLFIAGEGSQRNVRSRHSHAHQMQINTPVAHPPSNQPRHVSVANIPGPALAGQWSHAPVSLDSHRRIHPSDIGRFGHEMNRPVAASSLTRSSMEVDGVYHSNQISNRNPGTPFPLPTLHVPTMRGTGVGRSSYGQRTTYRAIPSYRSVGFASTLDDSRRPGVEAMPPLRHSRPLSIVGRSGGDRIGRVRNLHDRFQSFSDGDNARNRWASEGAYYGSRNFFDQHRDMRLDIDSMSYEELLALGERIGNVNTGVSEGTISKCLTEATYCSDQTEDEEVSCIICLEEYKDRESLGRLKCGHEFHFSCIKKWLMIKNACPICKASAAEEEK